MEELDDREIYWINYYDTYYNGYNMTFGGQFNLSDNPDNASLMRGGKPFLVFDLDGRFITKSISQTQFAEEIGVAIPAVNRVLQGRRSSTQGYVLIFEDDFTEDVLKDRLNKSRNRDFYVFDKNTLKFIGKWNDRVQCADEIGIDRSTITSKLNNNNYGHRCDYLFYFLLDIPKDLITKL